MTTITIDSKSAAFKAAWKYAKSLLADCAEYGWTLKKLFAKHLSSYMKMYWDNVTGRAKKAQEEAGRFYDKLGRFTND